MSAGDDAGSEKKGTKKGGLQQEKHLATKESLYPGWTRVSSPDNIQREQQFNPVLSQPSACRGAVSLKALLGPMEQYLGRMRCSV